MKYKDILQLFNLHSESLYFDVLIDKQTAQKLLDSGFKIVKLSVNNYKVYRMEN